MNKLVPSSLVFVLATLASAQSSVPGRMLVGFKSDLSPEEAEAVVKSAGGKNSKKLGDLNVHVVELPETANFHAVENAFKGRKEVEFTEPDMIVSVDQVAPNDPSYPSQWHLPKIQTPTAWSTTKGSTAIKIAILDSGVDPNHEDLYSRLVPGWNTFDGNNNTADVYGHGTKVAGTASASSNNGMGVAGVSWETLIMPIRVTDTAGYAYYSTLASGLNWAANNGARVANMSFDVTGSSTISSAAQYFQSKGGVVITSAGNSGAASDLAPSPYMTTVSGTDPNDAIYGWSTTGKRVTLSAPGCVTTTFNGNGYGGACGTSFASPIVAGVAALVLSANPNLTAAQVTSILQTTSDDLGVAGLDPIFGYGRVNAAKAVQLAYTPPPVTTTPTNPTPTPTPVAPPAPADTTAPSISVSSPRAGVYLSGNVSVSFAASDNKGVVKVELLVNGKTTGTSTSAPFTIRWQTNKIAKGSYSLQGRATDAAGNSTTSAAVLVYR